MWAPPRRHPAGFPLDGAPGAELHREQVEESSRANAYKRLENDLADFPRSWRACAWYEGIGWGPTICDRLGIEGHGLALGIGLDVDDALDPSRNDVLRAVVAGEC